MEDPLNTKVLIEGTTLRPPEGSTRVVVLSWEPSNDLESRMWDMDIRIKRISHEFEGVYVMEKRGYDELASRTAI